VFLNQIIGVVSCKNGSSQSCNHSVGLPSIG
jgi:hypothetical protein